MGNEARADGATVVERLHDAVFFRARFRELERDFEILERNFERRYLCKCGAFARAR